MRSGKLHVSLFLTFAYILVCTYIQPTYTRTQKYVAHTKLEEEILVEQEEGCQSEEHVISDL